MSKKPRNQKEANEAKREGKNKPKWYEYADFLRKLAVSYRMSGDLKMASYFKRWAQRLER